METIIATLIVSGAVLLFLEVYLPGLVAGIVGVICLFVAAILGYMHFGASTGNLILLGILAGFMAGAWAWLKYFPDSRMAKPLISQSTIGNVNTENPKLLGKRGTALTDLRPSGTAEIEGQRMDVVSDGSFVTKGATVKVAEVQGLRIVVTTI